MVLRRLEIQDASEETEHRGYGGEVDLHNLRTIATISGWLIEQPDLTKAAQMISGGKVEINQTKSVEASRGQSAHSESNSSGAGSISLAMLIVLVTVCLGFLVAVTNEAVRGSLDLKAYIQWMIAFLSALGVTVGASALHKRFER